MGAFHKDFNFALPCVLNSDSRNLILGGERNLKFARELFFAFGYLAVQRNPSILKELKECNISVVCAHWLIAEVIVDLHPSIRVEKDTVFK